MKKKVDINKNDAIDLKLTIGQTDKSYDYKRRLNRKVFLINLTLVIAAVIFVINMWALLYGDYVYEYLKRMK